MSFNQPIEFATNGASVAQYNFDEIETRLLLHWGKCLVATVSALPANHRIGNRLEADAAGNLNAVGIDGKTDLAVGDRVLVKNEAATEKNGLYYVVYLGGFLNQWILKRTRDAEASNEVLHGMQVSITDGSVNEGTTWQLTTANPIVLNSTGLTFTIMSSLGIDLSGIASGYIPKKDSTDGLEQSAVFEVIQTFGPDIQVAGALRPYALVPVGTTWILSADNQTLNVGGTPSFVEVTSDNSDPAVRNFGFTVSLNASLHGQELQVRWYGSTAGRMLKSDGRHTLTTDWYPKAGDILHLRYDLVSNTWREEWRHYSVQGQVLRLWTTVNTDSSSGTGATHAHPFTVPANTLNADGDLIEFDYCGACTGVSDTRTITFYFDGTGFLFTAFAPTAWHLVVKIMRLTSSTYSKSMELFLSGSPSGYEFNSEVDTGADFTAGIDTKLVLQAPVSGDIFSQRMFAEKRFT